MDYLFLYLVHIQVSGKQRMNNKNKQIYFAAYAILNYNMTNDIFSANFDMALFQTHWRVQVPNNIII